MCVLRSCVPPEQILHSIKQEYKRIQKRKHLDGGYLQSECSYSPESLSQSSSMHISSMSGWLPPLSNKEWPRTLVSAKLIDNKLFLLCPGASPGGVSPTRKEQPLFTLRQVGIICERLLKEREEKVREEYEETMTSKLAGWYRS